MRIKITNDLFDIANRVREINTSYEVYFDTDKQKYIIMAFGMPQVTVPYDNLDVRTLDYLYDTRRENIDKILKEVDKFNIDKQREDVKRVRDEIENEYSRRLRLNL